MCSDGFRKFFGGFQVGLDGFPKGFLGGSQWAFGARMRYAGNYVLYTPGDSRIPPEFIFHNLRREVEVKQV